MYAFACGIHTSLAAVALAAREVGRPVVRLTEIQSAKWKQRQQWAADCGCDKWPWVHRTSFAIDSRGFESIPVILAHPRQARAERARLYVEPGFALGVC